MSRQRTEKAQPNSILNMAEIITFQIFLSDVRHAISSPLLEELCPNKDCPDTDLVSILGDLSPDTICEILLRGWMASLVTLISTSQQSLQRTKNDPMTTTIEATRRPSRVPIVNC
ncbi:hypothetical protein TNIN_407301 [Trichonephila inaurata madagascariensis]|uniref:Uncharacterized protein n=1 Tax=Trichonephila inaurata madagascariensis TaxID=2747483 RepID=A0A8X7CSV2_9ARAC|nr:hypothetical protein TNIN_407301 [Trichonephila inaurata madagascariensis]